MSPDPAWRMENGGGRGPGPRGAEGTRELRGGARRSLGSRAHRRLLAPGLRTAGRRAARARHRRAGGNNETRGARLSAATLGLGGRAARRAPHPEAAAGGGAEHRWSRGAEPSGRPRRVGATRGYARRRRGRMATGAPSCAARTVRPQPGPCCPGRLRECGSAWCARPSGCWGIKCDKRGSDFSASRSGRRLSPARRVRRRDQVSKGTCVRCLPRRASGSLLHPELRVCPKPRSQMPVWGPLSVVWGEAATLRRG